MDLSFRPRRDRIHWLRHVSAIFYLGVLVSVATPQSVNVPLDHWAYPFLDRLQTKGLYSSDNFDIFPYSRETIAKIILQIDATVRADSSLFSHAEKELFEQLKGEFHEDLERLGADIRIDPKEHERNLFSWRNDDLTAHFDAIGTQQFRLESETSVDPTIPKSTTAWGLRGRVLIKESMAIFGDARSIVLSGADSLGNTTFNPSLGLPITEENLFGATVTDNASGYAVFRLPWFDLQVGRDLVEWGPGSRGSLILSRTSNYYDMFKTSFNYDKFKFEYVHAFLNAEQTKYLAGHRLEIRPTKSLRLSVNETVVYGNRDVEFLYANPFIPIIIAERHVGNKDNNMVSFDASWFVPKARLKLYGEVLFDDFSFAKNLFNDFVNKWGVLFGMYWVDPLGWQNTDLRVELIRIQPFVYSHRDPVNTYSNYNNSIGHWLGPDADDWYIELRRRLNKNVMLGISWERRRRGQNDINFGERPEDRRIEFLTEPVEKSLFYSVSVEWQVMRDLFVTARYNYIQTDNLRRVAGNDQNNHRLLLTMSLNY